MNKRLLLSSAIAGATILAMPFAAFADTTTTNFETFALGSVNGQQGWTSTGNYDQAVVTNPGVAGFGTKSLRISDATASGSFGDQTFSSSLTNEAGEAVAENGGMSGGTRQPHFEAQFDIASMLSTLQTGMHISVSPDRGDGARMSYLRFEDQADGIHVFFDDVSSTGTLNSATFNETDIATISRTPHTIKFVMDFVAGPSNDVVKIYIDGVLKATGTSWEDYYRYDTESNPSAPADTSRTVDSLLFRVSGAADPANLGNGFLFDNLSLMSGPSVAADTTPPPAPTPVSPANGSTLTTAQLTHVDWTDVTDPSSPVTYRYEVSNSPATNGDGSFVTPVYQSGVLTTSEIPTPGTPTGTYYWHARAVDSANNMSTWSTTSSFIIDNTVVTPPPATPTDKDQCKGNGWKTFTNPSFKNQGQCVAYTNHN